MSRYCPLFIILFDIAVISEEAFSLSFFLDRGAECKNDLGIREQESDPRVDSHECLAVIINIG